MIGEVAAGYAASIGPDGRLRRTNAERSRRISDQFVSSERWFVAGFHSRTDRLSRATPSISQYR